MNNATVEYFSFVVTSSLVWHWLATSLLMRTQSDQIYVMGKDLLDQSITGYSAQLN